MYFVLVVLISVYHMIPNCKLKVKIQIFSQMSKFTQNDSTGHKQHFHKIFTSQNLIICTNEDF